ncbi:MAG TPA: ABC transporter permease [Bryobacteraceae bacterium]|nr:ABC transporter permease [Bryobacteraceae bacterium]
MRARDIFDALFRRERVERELDEELSSSIEMMAERLMARGMPEEAARREARLQFEGVSQVKERMRDEMAVAWVESWLQDARYAWRVFWKRPSFTLIAVLTLALGIGANAAIFSVVYAVLLKPLGYEKPEQLAMIWSDFEKTAALKAPASGTIFGEIQHRTQLLQEVAAMWPTTGTFVGEQDAEQVKYAQVTPNFFKVLGVQPQIGRWFAQDEDMLGRPAMMITDSLWHRRFGGDRNLIGRSVLFGGRNCTVIGVLPAGFRLRLEAKVPADIDAYTPFYGNIYQRPRTLYYLRLIARMKPGVRVEQAQQEMNRIAGEIRGGYVEFQKENLQLKIVSLQADAVHDIRPALMALFAGAGLVMLICCVNVANLLLARASGRRKEIAVRGAIGASKARVLRQLLTEGLLLCAVAGLAGVGLGWAALGGLLRFEPDALARAGEIGMNWVVFGFVAAISLASVMLFALAPAIELAKWDLITTLRESSRTTRTPFKRGARAALIVSEIALGFMLVIGAGLMIRTLEKIDRVAPGFEAEGVLTFSMALPFERFKTDEALFDFVRECDARFAALPGATASGASSHLPLDDYANWYSAFRPQGMTDTEGAKYLADYRSITPGFLRAMGTRLIAGRFFDERDRAGAKLVVIVDDLLASTIWPGEKAIGKQIEAEHITDRGFVPQWAEVVGVVEHLRMHELSKKVRPEIYIPWEQSARSPVSFAIRAKVDPMTLVGPVRELLREGAPFIAISKVRPMTQFVERAKAPATFTAALAGIFGGLALVLAAIGIYGVVYYSVSSRMHEMGVRMALGATGRDVKRLVLGEGLGLAAIGIALGAAGALVASREFADLIYGIRLVDPVTYGATIAALAGAALVGCWRPASKAARANPVDAIRME